MEATALSVGKSVLDGAIGYAKSTLAEEVALQLGIQRDHAFIRDELQMMQAFLMSAHDDQDKHKVFMAWVKQVRDVAYDAEDCLQDFSIHLKEPPWWRLPRTLRERRRIAKQMKELRARVEDVSQRNLRYQLTKSSSSNPAATTVAEMSSITNATIFGVGEARRATRQEEPKEDLVSLINKEDENLRVIALWGTNGDLGLTTIISTAYENPDITGKFPCRAWIRILHPFNPNDFIQGLVKQFRSPEGVEILLEKEKTGHDLAKEFTGYVSEKSYLIVLNDLTTFEEWNVIRRCFPNSKKGSRIVVCASQVEVASLCAGQESHVAELKQLSADQTIYAFFEKDFQNQNETPLLNPNSNDATTSTSNPVVLTNEVLGNQCEGGDERNVVTENITRIKTMEKHSSKEQDSICELKVLEDKEALNLFAMKDFDNQKETPLQSSGSNDATTTSNNHMVLTNDVVGNQSEGGDERKMVTKCITRIKTMASALEESQLVGREKEKSKIIDLLSYQPNQELRVISVWGMGGLGKTTLVKDVYQSQINMFEKHAFVTVLRPFILKELLQSLVMQLTAESSETKRALDFKPNTRNNVATMRTDSLIKELDMVIKGKKCLIVLDDLSSTTEWDHIMDRFPKLDCASRILITTREYSIAKHCSGEQDRIRELKVLGHKEALNLFTRKVFKESIHWDKHPDLIKEAQLILKKCDGLPLAIVTIGGFLANQPKNVVEWRKLVENISAELEMNPELEPIRTILGKSYDGLPYHLKSCFLYLSIFPEDHKISRRRLIQRWVAEGYSRKIHEKSAEEISDDYFKKLIGRSMILSSNKSFGITTVIDSCQVHDLMREISISKATEENLVFRLDESCISNTQKIVRHLSISSNWTGDKGEFESAVDLSRIRSLTVFGEWRSFYISKKMRLLRVLDLESTKGLIDHHLEHIGSLLHLKYISLRGCLDIYHLPDSWGNLLQLETLDIKYTRICKLPQTIIKLRKLQHLFGGELGPACVNPNERIPNEQIKLCLACCAPKHLKDVECMDGDPNRHDVCTFWWHVIFPTLASRRLDPCGIVLPKGVRKLKNMRTLGVVNIVKGKAILQEIRRLTQLRKLAVTGVNKENSQEFCSTIGDLNRLESLSVQSSRGESGLHGLLNEVCMPSSNLQSLKLYGKLVKLPGWIGALQNLVKLRLQSTMLSEVDSTMQILGKLPNLAILRLLWKSFDCEEPHRLSFCQEGPFQKLMVLELNCVWGLNSAEYVFEKGATPELELLCFAGCGDEQKRAFSGLATLPKLKEFVQGSYTYKFEEDVRAQLATNSNGPIFKKISKHEW